MFVSLQINSMLLSGALLWSIDHWWRALPHPSAFHYNVSDWRKYINEFFFVLKLALANVYIFVSKYIGWFVHYTCAEPSLELVCYGAHIWAGLRFLLFHRMFLGEKPILLLKFHIVWDTKLIMWHLDFISYGVAAHISCFHGWALYIEQPMWPN
jgi:hypothetical protein